MNTKNILLINAEGVQAICMARSLRKQGHRVVGFCNHKMTSGYATRWLSEKHVSPDITLKCDAFELFLFDYLKSHQIDVIIPLADDGAEFLSKNKERIEAMGIRCAIPSFDVFNIANDKQKLMELCERYNLSHPKTRELNPKDLKSTADYVGFPAMIKPNLSQGAKGIVRVNNMEELKEKFPNIYKQFGTCTLQQYVDQPDYYYNVMIYRDKCGKIAGQTIIKIRRYFPLKGGTSCYSETVEHPFLLKECEEVLNKLGWVGFADFDVLEDKHSRELNIIEINPRVPSSLQASFAAGVDFAKIFVDEYLGNGAEVFDMKKYKSGQQVRWFGLDVMWFLMSPQRFSFKPSWFKFWGKNVSYHDGTWSDPIPMIAGCLQGVVKYLDPNFRKAKFTNMEMKIMRNSRGGVNLTFEFVSFHNSYIKAA